jgi:trans-aconitate 2-methyltransferase
MTTNWDPEQYRRFSDERNRPFFDLLAQVNHPQPHTIADLGCGDGRLTQVLGQRWPEANVLGIDSSSEMLSQAQALISDSNHHVLRFEHGDIAQWQPTNPFDLIVSNAALQWLDHHEQLWPRLAGMLQPGGVLAIQIPANFDAPSHRLLDKCCQSHPQLASYSRSNPVLPLQRYAELLLGLNMRVDAWETEYLHVLSEENPVLQWMKGTALRPILAALPSTEHEAFLAEYGAKLTQAYPSTAHGTVFPFRRFFMVCTKA